MTTTIKDAANEYAETRYSRKEHPTVDACSAARNGFLAGVEFAQRWISVEDELPEIETTVIVKYRYDSGSIKGIFYSLLRRIKTKDTAKKWHWSAYDVKTYFAQKVIEWRYLELN